MVKSKSERITKLITALRTEASDKTSEIAEILKEVNKMRIKVKDLNATADKNEIFAENLRADIEFLNEQIRILEKQKQEALAEEGEN